MLPARKMTSIRHAWFAKYFPINKIDLKDTRMELWDFCQIHAERPHCFQWRVDDDRLLGSKRWSQSYLQIACVGSPSHANETASVVTNTVAYLFAAGGKRHHASYS
jgi:hypothetical protein